MNPKKAMKLDGKTKRSFKDYIQRIDEILKDAVRSVLIFLDNYPSHINVHLFK